MLGERGNDIHDVRFVSRMSDDLDVVQIKTFEELDDFWIGLHGFGQEVFKLVWKVSIKPAGCGVIDLIIQIGKHVTDVVDLGLQG